MIFPTSGFTRIWLEWSCSGARQGRKLAQHHSKNRSLNRSLKFTIVSVIQWMGPSQFFSYLIKNTFPHFGIFGSSLYLHLYLYLYLYLDLYLVRAEARQSGSTLTWQLIYSDQIWQSIFKFSQSFLYKDGFLTFVCICIPNNRGENLYLSISKCIFCILTWN